MIRQIATAICIAMPPEISVAEGEVGVVLLVPFLGY